MGSSKCLYKLYIVYENGTNATYNSNETDAQYQQHHNKGYEGLVKRVLSVASNWKFARMYRQSDNTIVAHFHPSTGTRALTEAECMSEQEAKRKHRYKFYCVPNLIQQNAGMKPYSHFSNDREDAHDYMQSHLSHIIIYDLTKPSHEQAIGTLEPAPPPPSIFERYKNR